MDPRAFALASNIANALATQDPRTQSDALNHLAQTVDNAYGDDAIYLCDFIRLNGLVQLLGDLIASPDPGLHQPASGRGMLKCGRARRERGVREGGRDVK